MFDYNIFLDTIIAIRKEKGYTQEKLANEIGISKQAIQKIEARTNAMKMENLEKIAQVLDFDLQIVPNTSVVQDTQPRPATIKKQQTTKGDKHKVHYKVKLYENDKLISEHIKETWEQVESTKKIAEMFSTVTSTKQYTISVEEVTE